MRVVRCTSKEQLAYDAAVAGADRIREALHRRGRANIVVATGMSQAEMLGFLVREKLDWGRVTAFHLDEYCGMKPNHPASFRKYLQERFVSQVPLKAFVPILGEKNPITECCRLNKILPKYPIDVAFVGIGENGHLAFNDPPADFGVESPYIVVRLDKACRRQQVKEGWFGTLLQVPTKAISMSIQQIMKAESIICTVPDKRKAKAVKAALEGKVTPDVPASILQQHPQASIFLDPESGALLKASKRPMLLKLLTLKDAPTPLVPGSKKFHLLVAGDWKRIPEGEVAKFAQKAISSGAASLTAFGAGSFAVKLAVENDSVRRTVAGSGRTAAAVLPTACYKADQIDQALYHFLEDVKGEAPGCGTWAAVVVDDVAHRDRLLEVLGAPGAFIDKYINPD